MTPLGCLTEAIDGHLRGQHLDRRQVIIVTAEPDVWRGKLRRAIDELPADAAANVTKIALGGTGLRMLQTRAAGSITIFTRNQVRGGAGRALVADRVVIDVEDVVVQLAPCMASSSVGSFHVVLELGA